MPRSYVGEGRWVPPQFTSRWAVAPRIGVGHGRYTRPIPTPGLKHIIPMAKCWSLSRVLPRDGRDETILVSRYQTIEMMKQSHEMLHTHKSVSPTK